MPRGFRRFHFFNGTDEDADDVELKAYTGPNPALDPEVATLPKLRHVLYKESGVIHVNSRTVPPGSIGSVRVTFEFAGAAQLPIVLSAPAGHGIVCVTCCVEHDSEDPDEYVATIRAECENLATQATLIVDDPADDIPLVVPAPPQPPHPPHPKAKARDRKDRKARTRRDR